MGLHIIRELSTNSGDNFVDIGTVIPGNAYCAHDDEPWKRPISQFFSIKINNLKIASLRGQNTGFFKISVHKSVRTMEKMSLFHYERFLECMFHGIASL